MSDMSSASPRTSATTRAEGESPHETSRLLRALMSASTAGVDLPRAGGGKAGPPIDLYSALTHMALRLEERRPSLDTARAFTTGLYAQWGGWELARPAAGAWSNALERMQAYAVAKADTRTLPEKLGSLGKEFTAECEVAWPALDLLRSRGLELRHGLFLQPPVPSPQSYVEWAAWRTVSFAFDTAARALKQESSCPLCVCQSCTAIFQPRRKRFARYCPLCERPEPAKPALGGLPLTGPIRTKTADGKRFEAVRPAWPTRARPLKVRVPVTRNERVLRWGRATAGLCEECGVPVYNRKTCSESCRQKKNRRSKNSGT